jgi:hypothetical protein
MNVPWRPALLGFAGAAALAAAGGFLTGGGDDSAVRNSIAFNHRKHVVDNEIGCDTCHVYVSEQTFSGLPDADVCSSCHAEALGKSAEEAKLVRMLAEETPLEWKRLFRQPSHVFYSHRRHVAVSGIECPVCHQDIGRSQSPPARVRRLRMDDCIACHESKGVSTNCTACHR